jgi:hypothetical protein
MDLNGFWENFSTNVLIFNQAKILIIKDVRWWLITDYWLLITDYWLLIKAHPKILSKRLKI